MGSTEALESAREGDLREAPDGFDGTSAGASAQAAERLELAAVLMSKAFFRSPNLAQLLAYLCSRYFNGTCSELKEYVVGIEAFGRPQSFDPKKDSVVRVQIHRLRERLAEYYHNEGAANRLRLEIPPGSYAPRFALNPSEIDIPRGPEGTSQAEPATSPQTPILPPSVSSAGEAKSARPLALWWLAAAAIAFCAVGAYLTMRRPARITTPVAASPTAVLTTTSASVGLLAAPTIRVLAGLGGSSWTDGVGNQWLSDRYFDGGRVVETRNQFISGTHDQRLFQSRREGVFEYAIPLQPGNWELRLYFAETYFGEMNVDSIGGETSRVFGLEINGDRVLNRFDVTLEGGGATAVVKAFGDVHPAADGKLHLRFVPINSVPFVNAIEITPGTHGKMVPLRLVERTSPLVDSRGRDWQPDRLVTGGQLVERRRPVVDAADPALHQWRRFGNLAWNIPVTHKGTYTLRIYLAESWLRPDDPQSREGRRVFDILCNGVLLERDVDVFKRVGTDHELVLTFHGIVPDAFNRLRLAFAAKRSYPELAALEVEQE